MNTFSFEVRTAGAGAAHDGKRRFLVTSYDAFWRAYEQLEAHDRHFYELIRSGEPCLLYAAQFGKGDSGLIAAGGSGANEAKVFDRHAGNAVVGTVTGLSRGVFTLDFSPDISHSVYIPIHNPDRVSQLAHQVEDFCRDFDEMIGRQRQPPIQARD